MLGEKIASPKSWRGKEFSNQELKGRGIVSHIRFSRGCGFLAEQMGIPRADNHFSGDSDLHNAFCLVS